MKKIKVVNKIHILPGVLFGFIANSIKGPRSFRRQVVAQAWNLIKQQAAGSVETIEVSRIDGIDKALVNVTVNSYDRAVLCAITKITQPKTFFEIGTYLGETTLAVARNNPQATIYTLDLPAPEGRKSATLEMTDEYLFDRWDRGSAFAGTPEAGRIQQLAGDSASFDFTPYIGKMDAVFVDASHSYSYVKSDTEAALKILSPTGTILWHDYPTYPGIFAYLNELGAKSDGKIYHVMGTGLALSSRMNLIT